jgi:hypothetical protein
MSKVRILTMTGAGDEHSVAVSAALTLSGHRVLHWFGANFPQRQRTSFEVRETSSAVWFVNDAITQFGSADFDVVWLRRPRMPVVSSMLHPGDAKIASDECEVFYASLWKLMGMTAGAFWVNSMAGRRLGESKLAQLALAKDVGLTVPRTLISNDPSRLRRFLADVPATVCKALLGAGWADGEGRILGTYTSSLCAEDLPSDAALQACPVILQEKIDKQYEVRLTVMGRTCIGARLNSSSIPGAEEDWRVAELGKLRIESIEVPEVVRQKCFALMDALGIIFGAFDFIVTNEGNYIFLEVNQMGQFLWVEYANPNLLLLDCFVSFLVSRDPKFIWRPSAQALRLADVARTDIFSKFQVEHSLQTEDPAHTVVL